MLIYVTLFPGAQTKYFLKCLHLGVLHTLQPIHRSVIEFHAQKVRLYPPPSPHTSNTKAKNIIPVLAGVCAGGGFKELTDNVTIRTVLGPQNTL